MRARAALLALTALPLGAASCAIVGDFDFDDWQEEQPASGGGGGQGGDTFVGGGGGGPTGGAGAGASGGTGAGASGGQGGAGGDVPDGYLPDSPTELCSDGTFVDCGMVGVFAGQDGNYRIDVPAYSTAGGVVTDSISELRWQQTSAVTSTSASAASACAALPAEPDCTWRVPTYVELLTLVDYGTTAPALAPVFAEAGRHRSSDLEAGDAWGIDFDTGRTALIVDGVAAQVRCVCGTSPDPGFTTVDPWIRDERTGLIWQDDFQGTKVDWEQFLLDCESLSLAGLDWRLPSIKELASILDPSDPTAPKLDDAFFFVPGRYASSTPVADDPTMHWTVNFNTGSIVAEPIVGGPSLVVRCVSGPEMP